MSLKISAIAASARPFIFSLTIIPSASVKALHLRSHLRSLGFLDWIILLPSLLLPDIALAVLARLLLARAVRGWKMFDPALLLGLAIAAITTVAAAIEIAFYWETGGEIAWSAANRFYNDPAGTKLLLSGLNKVLCALFLLFIMAKMSGSYFYNAIGNGLLFIMDQFKRRFDISVWRRRSSKLDDENLLFSSAKVHNLKITTFSSPKKLFQNACPIIAVLYVITLVTYVRKTNTPYYHLMGSLPFTLMGSSELNDREFCAEVDNVDHVVRRPFPLVDLISNWKAEEGEFSARWSPWNFMSGKGEPLEPVDWLPKTPVTGFQRWYNTSLISQLNHYDPRYDPLRISNNDLPILETLQEAFRQHNVVIKNVMMITLESMRKDVFPLKKESHLYNTILSSHESSASLKPLESLANISRTSELLTGESGGFESADVTQVYPLGNWRNAKSNLGGLNIIGATSSSTLTAKNLVTVHCGVYSVPVDFTAEIYSDIYQPCLPHILDLFNNRKRAISSQNTEDFRSQEWDMAFLQSGTGRLDFQTTLMKKIGFNNSILLEQLQDSHSKFYPPTEPEFGYLGLPDSQVKPYLRDIIETARDNSHRFFISHITTTTHHPWELPIAFGKPRKYIGRKGWVLHQDLNNYLNTVKYSDVWLEEILGILEDTGATNETLVVVAGDHGFAIGENDLSSSTVNGPHIKNFQIPLVFHHPRMPRLQLMANASTMSILPTILDLLASSDSLDAADQNTITHLLHEYEGQSLIREYKSEQHGRQNWHMSIINPGGRLLAVSSAATSWRLVMPLCHTAMFRFTDLSRYALEERKLEAWSIEMLVSAVAREYGSDAAKWVADAEAVGTWWYWETRRVWKFGGKGYGDEFALPEIMDRWLNPAAAV